MQEKWPSEKCFQVEEVKVFLKIYSEFLIQSCKETIYQEKKVISHFSAILDIDGSSFPVRDSSKMSLAKFTVFLTFNLKRFIFFVILSRKTLE